MEPKPRVRVLIGANDLLLAGVQRLVVEQLVAMDRSRFEPHLVVLRSFPGRKTFRDRIPADVTVTELSFSGLFDLPEWIRLAWVLRHTCPDIVKTATFFSNFIFLVLRPFFGYKVIAAEHNTVLRKPFIQRVLDRLLLPYAWTVIADSKMVVDFIVEGERIPREKFRVLYNGVDVNAVREARARYGPRRRELREELGIPADAHVLFTAARLVRQKNHTLMVEGFAQALKTEPGLFLLIAGEGGLRPELEELVASLGVGERVRLLGEQTDVYRYYALADTFILTSRHEGFCIAAMEGLAFAQPVISTRVAGIVEYIREGENGVFVDPTPEDVARGILHIEALTPSERERYAAAGQRTAEEYSFERYGREFNQLLADASA